MAQSTTLPVRPAAISGFLSFNKMPPKLVIAADATEEDFDQTLMDHLEEEGYDVIYLPYEGGGKEYANELKALGDDLELGETYSLVVFGVAAADALQVHLKPMPKLNSLIAYYPPVLPPKNANYPPSLPVLIHLTNPHPPVTNCKSYTYYHVQNGFAEHNKPQFDAVSASLAWSRTLGQIRKGFKIEVDLERVWEGHLNNEFRQKDASSTVAAMVPDAYVNHVPTMTGGIGTDDLLRFYRDFFVQDNPPSLKFRLVSRTTGVDRIVDEMVLLFDHTEEMPWMLPEVPPTNKHVEIAIVSIVCIRGGKLYHEHVYWDQASVLLQIGLLDPNLGKGGVERLPVTGAESAKKVLDAHSYESNDLLEDWWTDEEDESEDESEEEEDEEDEDEDEKEDGEEDEDEDDKDEEDEEEKEEDEEDENGDEGRKEEGKQLQDKGKVKAQAQDQDQARPNKEQQKQKANQ
ncbi:NTF2-like protein [Xylona heveae TC161]|uniref:NTF2-like protein n=1 Tax=Xylona heveae (strain CBS 132557 / TC161) TaxID=1328760 RepID=A0A165I8D8_XYLHT|nr:NTF2-like protein [Xylona heveae TC161]KZF24532.1 NTF2-like protein [Xylona heveae TC161]